MTRVLVIDNYDSFAYNLVQYLGELADDVIVRRNDAIDVDGIRSLGPDAVVVSPGPGTPQEAGVSIPVFRELRLPTLGVCLGHQALCAACGGTVESAPHVVHGKPSRVTHDDRGVFDGLPDPIEVGRYHSLCVTHRQLPEELAVTARTIVESDGTAENDQTADGVVMGVRHDRRPHVGVQFHPESVLTEAGKRLLWNFLSAHTEHARPPESADAKG